MSKTKVHQQFKVSRSTIDDWLTLRAESGDVKATTRYYRGRPSILVDSAEVRAFIEAHHHSTLGEMAAAWQQEQGQRLCVTTFHNALKRLGYTRKKRATSTKSVH